MGRQEVCPYAPSLYNSPVRHRIFMARMVPMIPMSRMDLFVKELQFLHPNHTYTADGWCQAPKLAQFRPAIAGSNTSSR